VKPLYCKKTGQEGYMYFVERPLELNVKIAQNLSTSRRNITGEQFHKYVFEVKEYLTVKDCYT
jgi:hypothetical protein